MTDGRCGAEDALVARLRAAGSVFAEDEARALREGLGAEGLEQAVRRRVAGEPLEHVVGHADFAGVRVVVRPPVFVPRRRAEALVDVAARFLARPDAVVVDLGCGSGAVAAALSHRCPSIRCHATDLDPDAVACARENAAGFGFAVHQGSWLSALPERLRGSVDLVVAHLPYVPTRDLPFVPRDYREAERSLALDGGEDGLDPLRGVLAELPGWLVPGGRLVTHVALVQVSTAGDLVARAGLVASWHGDDETPVLVATRPRGSDQPA